MMDYAHRTGLIQPGSPVRRYLWTDAFAVCNFLGMYMSTGETQYRELALQLVDQVHHVLGRHRLDDPRSGWISGLDEQEGERHPTIGGLRIGKDINERGPDEPYDEQREWDRDGQYFHYLTKWMHALHRVSRVTGDALYNRWAIELAQTAHARFVHAPAAGGGKRMYWKMSIDLSRPLVPSMGQQDPLDGYITWNQLQRCHPAGYAEKPSAVLEDEIKEMAELCAGSRWVTDDVLGLGGLLSDAWKVAQLMIHCDFNQPDLLEGMLKDALTGMHFVGRGEVFRLPAAYRLPFREFGLAIGLQAVQRLQQSLEEQPDRYPGHAQYQQIVERLLSYLPLAKEITDFWQNPHNQQAETWKDHLDINAVMLATSLAPDGFLTI